MNIFTFSKDLSNESERNFILSYTVALASIKNKKDLSKVINVQLKEFIRFSYSTIFILNNEDQITVSPFILDPGSKSRTQPSCQEVITDKYPITDGILNRIFASAAPIVFDLDELSKGSELPKWAKMAFENGIRQTAGARFSRNEQVFGFWFIHFEENILINERRLCLIEVLANQISIAVFNIIANDKIESLLIEIRGYKQQLEEEKIYLKEEIEITNNYSEIVGESAAMKKIFRLVSQVAPSDSTVLILGETGTGKELIARAIHNGSPRKSKLMVNVNCAALPANLIESELFGHERGSFTGAIDRRIGKFELASGGTLFLDEIGEMPLDLQAKLLRVLQEREIERVGGRSTIKVDVRIIAATNRDLEKETGEGRFRSDLYYRLNIFPISLPPLRDRREDIPLLASRFIQRFAKKNGRNINALNNSAMQQLVQYDWPGNIREMEHLIERSILLSSGNTIKQIPLPSKKLLAAVNPPRVPLILKTIEENERDHILETLKYCGGRIAGAGGAAEILGVPTSTLNSKIKRLAIKRKHITDK